MNDFVQAALARNPPTVSRISVKGTANSRAKPTSSPGSGLLRLKLGVLFRYFGLDVDGANYSNNRVRKQIDRIQKWITEEVGDQPGEINHFLATIDGTLRKKDFEGQGSQGKLNVVYNYLHLRRWIQEHPGDLDAHKELVSYHADPTKAVMIPNLPSKLTVSPIQEVAAEQNYETRSPTP